MNAMNGAGPAVSPASPVPTAISQPASQHGNGTAPDVYRAINQISKVLSRDGIAKSRRNEQQGYGFRGVDDVMNALSALLAGADLIILPRMRSRTQEERTTPKGAVLFYVTVRACFDFVSARDGSCHTVIMYGEAMDSADKATNKAMSAAYKYACLQVFCIPTEGMADADQTTPVPEPKPEPTPVPEPKPKPAPKPVAVATPKPRLPENMLAPAAREKQPATPKPPARERQPAPWTNRMTMRTYFGRVRERVGEVTYLEAIEKFGLDIKLMFAPTPENWERALDCYEHLIERAVA